MGGTEDFLVANFHALAYLFLYCLYILLPFLPYILQKPAEESMTIPA